MKIVVAIDSFKGSLTSKEANQAAATSIYSIHPEAEIIQVPVSDGGEGFLEAFHAAIGGEMIELMVRDPLMRPVSAQYLLQDKLALIEITQASGLTLLTKEERNPLVATSYGTGQLVADAVRKGAAHIIVGLGGSATCDAGMGMLRALIDSFAKHGNWDDIGELKHVRFTIASDVTNPLCGENGAAHVFAPQKGATPAMVRQLDERARKFADGKPGIELLLDTIKFREMVKDANLVITGEGSADHQTLMGKLPMGILKQSGDVPVCLIAGRISDREDLLKAGFTHVACINPKGITLEEAMRKEVATRNIGQTLLSITHVIISHTDTYKDI